MRHATVLVLVVTSLLVPGLAAAQLELGPELEVVRSTSHGERVRVADASVVDDGTLLVAWRDDSECRVRFVDRAGARLGAELTFAPSCDAVATERLGDAAVVMWAAGNAVRWRRLDLATRSWLDASPRELAERIGELSLACHASGCLLAYRKDGPGGEPDVWAIRLGADAALLDAAPFAIATGTYAEFAPSVATDGTDFMVAYTQYTSLSFLASPHPMGVFATPVAADGTVLEATTLALPAELFLIPVAEATIAYGEGAYVVAWNGGGFRGARLAPNGTVLTPSTSLEPMGAGYRPGETYAHDNAVYVSDGRVEALFRVQRNEGGHTYYDLYAAAFDATTLEALGTPVRLFDAGYVQSAKLVEAASGLDAVWLAQARNIGTMTLVARTVSGGAPSGFQRELLTRGGTLSSPWLVADATTTWAGARSPVGDVSSTRYRFHASTGTATAPIVVDECSACSVRAYRRGDVVELVRLGLEPVARTIGRDLSVGEERAVALADVVGSSEWGTIGARVDYGLEAFRIEAGVIAEGGLDGAHVIASVPRASFDGDAGATGIESLRVAWVDGRALVLWQEAREAMIGGSTRIVYTTRARALEPDGTPVGAGATTLPFDASVVALVSGESAALLVLSGSSSPGRYGLLAARLDRSGAPLDAAPVALVDELQVVESVAALPFRPSAEDAASWALFVVARNGGTRIERACEIHASLRARCEPFSEQVAVVSSEPLETGWVASIRADGDAGDVLVVRSVRSAATFEPLPDAGVPLDAGAPLDAGVPLDAGGEGLDAGVLADSGIWYDAGAPGVDAAAAIDGGVSSADASTAPVEPADGCGCRAAGTGGSSRGALALALLALAIAWRRRRSA